VLKANTGLPPPYSAWHSSLNAMKVGEARRLSGPGRAKLEIENFRGIRESTVQFSPHTVFVGPNNCILPGESGTDLAHYAKSLRVPVVMISGDLGSLRTADDQHLQLLAKPFKIDQLAKALNMLLDSDKLGQRDA